MKNTLCINFYSGPGAGKSTIAAAVFAELKKKHVNCELITEFAKRKIWEGNKECLDNQLYITAKQHYLMWTVSKHVDVIVTDSPLLLGCVYGNDDLLDNLILREYGKFQNLDIFLERKLNTKYQSNGRMQTLKEAKQKDDEVLAVLKKANPDHLAIRVKDSIEKEITDLAMTRIRKVVRQAKKSAVRPSTPRKKS